jgi:hypothetical protein
MASVNHYPLSTDIDDGGAWLMDKSIFEATPFIANDRIFKGPVGVGGVAGSWEGESLPFQRPAAKTDSQLIQDGTTMVARSLPNNPAADTAVSIAEIAREGMPAVPVLQSWKERTQLARAHSNAGSEYLNFVFGWQPLVAGVRDFAKAVKNSDQIWSSYQKGSGMKTRVGYHLNDDKKTTSYTGNLQPVPSAYHSFLRGTIVVQTRTRTWFSGCFKYHVPDPTDYSGKMRYWQSQASKILGLNLTPEVLWNLAPWSWAADWFSNTGDVMHNISLLGQDGLVMQYGYAMSEQERVETRFARDTFLPARTASLRFTSARKKRIPATPYGFGVDMTTLNARQTAIVAALGLSFT